VNVTSSNKRSDIQSLHDDSVKPINRSNSFWIPITLIALVLLVPAAFYITADCTVVKNKFLNTPAQWFSRSGALMTLLSLLFDAIYISYRVKPSPLSDENEARMKTYREKFEGKITNIWLPAKNQAEKEILDGVAQENFERQESNKTTKHFDMAFLILAGIGTIIWGFGDIAFILLVN
jgi:hypothetical protein